MRDPQHPGSEADRREADRLGLVWNAIVRGDAPAVEDLDPDQAAVIRRLAELAPEPCPRPIFVQQLKEQLMDTTVSMPAVGRIPPEPLLSIVPVANVPAATASRGKRWFERSWRGLGTVATAALVVATLIGGYLAISWPRSGDDGQRGVTGELADGTPVVSDCASYHPGCPDVHQMGDGFINKPDLSAADLAATGAQLQGWTVDPGARIELGGDAAPGVHGAVVDVVVDGVYVVTVDAPAVVSRAGLPMEADVKYLPPGAVAELAQGDSISYPAGRKRTIVNPLSTVTLRFKSAVFYDGDVALTRPAELQPVGVRVQVDGDGVLPRPLADYVGNEVDVVLDYIQVPEGAELPDVRSGRQRIIGPVDPVQPEIQEGYVLWVGETHG
jgi:hypothetical protein